jgi:hypothetical protein
MTLRNFYIFMLYCSGFILMGHSFVPHNHNTSGSIEQSVVKHESSHHDDHHGHHHHKKAADEAPASDSPISHPLHQESITKFVLKQTTISIDLVKVMYLLPEYINITHTVPTKISTVPYKPDKNNLKLSCYRSSFALRGPPSTLFS